jgi:addiction module HigA family antidote
MNIDIPPIHPGEHLAEYLDEYGISQYRLAQSIHVPPRRINEIVHGKRRITADTALRLGRFFGVGAQFWLNLQTGYDLDVAQQEVGTEIESEIEPMERDAA